MRWFENPEVAGVFKTYPREIRKQLMSVRRLIFETASATEGVGELEETVRWGEPAYLTTQSKSGTTVRLGWKKIQSISVRFAFSLPEQAHRDMQDPFPRSISYQGNRSLLFNRDDKVPVEELSACLAIALTYHRKRRPNHRLHRARNHSLH